MSDGLMSSYRTLAAAQTVLSGRKGAEDILHSNDDRLLVVVGYDILSADLKATPR